MSCSCPQNVMGDNGYSSFCGLPARKNGAATSSPYPEACATPEVDVSFLPTPDLTPECPVRLDRPCTAPEGLPADCDWSAERVSSLPPALGCPPVNVGFGQFDGGMKYWGGEKDPTLLAECYDYVREKYVQWAWHHMMDLQQSQEWYSNLIVRRNGVGEDISEMEFITLAVKLSHIAQMLGATPAPFEPSKLAMDIQQTGTDANGIPTFSLVQIYDGQVISTGGMPLVAHWDTSGDPIGLTFPASLLPSLTVTP